jgi:hypothetical protein
MLGISYAQLREGLAKRQWEFLEIELSLAATFIDLAKMRYRIGEVHEGNRTKQRDSDRPQDSPSLYPNN